MRQLGQDFRLAFRTLRKSPAFAATTVLTLSLGIAVNATMFSLVSGFLLQRPPGHDPEHIIVVSAINPSGGFHADLSTVSAANFLAWRASNHSFSEMAASDGRTVSLRVLEQAIALEAGAVSANYFDVFEAASLRGRVFLSGEDQPGHDHVVVLSEGLWKRRFAADETVIGKTVRLNREDYTVIGVMPASFRLLGYSRELWIPLTVSAADQTAAAHKDRALHIFGRLKPGVTLDQARAELATLARQAQNDFPQVEKGWGATARMLPDFLIRDFDVRPALVVLMSVVGLVLMLACANVTGLLVSRAAGRQKELAIRLSLGAKASQIARQVFSESLIIALLGGSLGLVLAYWGINLVKTQFAFNEALSAVPLALDRNVLLFALSISVFSALLCGLAPALNASTTDINANLKAEGRAASPSRSHNRLRTVLVTGEIALSALLLIGTGLLIRGIFSLEHQHLGFAPDHLLTANVNLDSARYKDASQQLAFVRTLLPRLEQLPGVNSAAATSSLPATGPDSLPLQIQGRPEPAGAANLTTFDVVISPNYFRTAGVALLRGRSFRDSDNSNSTPVVLVNQEFARRFFGDQDPIGKRIALNLALAAPPQWKEIIGVVSDVKTFSEQTNEDPQVYEPIAQHPLGSFSLMLRTGTDPNTLSSALRGAVAQLDSELPLSKLMSMNAVIDRQKGGDTFFSHVLGTFAFLALMLAAIGIYGLIAYSVSRRSQEIGIRMAMGAQRSDVLLMILKQGCRMTLVGAAIGLILAVPLPKLFSSIFYGLNASEPGLYALVPAAIFVIASLAAYIPARRAAKVDPMVALRYE